MTVAAVAAGVPAGVAAAVAGAVMAQSLARRERDSEAGPLASQARPPGGHGRAGPAAPDPESGVTGPRRHQTPAPGKLGFR